MFKNNCFIILTLIYVGLFSRSAEAMFDSKKEMNKAIYQAEFSQILEIPYSRGLVTRFIQVSGNSTTLNINTDHPDFKPEPLDKLSYKGKAGFVGRKFYGLAFKVGDNLVCYRRYYDANSSVLAFSAVSKRLLRDANFNYCVVFPYQVDDVIKKIEK